MNSKMYSQMLRPIHFPHTDPTTSKFLWRKGRNISMAHVTIGSPIVRIYSQVADMGSACKLAPQSPGLPQTERLSMRVLKLILKLREVSPLAWELYTVSRKGEVTKHK